MPTTVQISCRIPIKIWNTIKALGEQRGTTATKITIKALETVIKDSSLQKSLSGITTGDKVSVTTHDGQKYSSYPVKSKKGELGIVARQTAQIFIPLSDFETIDVEE